MQRKTVKFLEEPNIDFYWPSARKIACSTFFKNPIHEGIATLHRDSLEQSLELLLSREDEGLAGKSEAEIEALTTEIELIKFCYDKISEEIHSEWSPKIIKVSSGLLEFLNSIDPEIPFLKYASVLDPDEIKELKDPESNNININLSEWDHPPRNRNLSKKIKPDLDKSSEMNFSFSLSRLFELQKSKHPEMPSSKNTSATDTDQNEEIKEYESNSKSFKM